MLPRIPRNAGITRHKVYGGQQEEPVHTANRVGDKQRNRHQMVLTHKRALGRVWKTDTLLARDSGNTVQVPPITNRVNCTLRVGLLKTYD